MDTKETLYFFLGWILSAVTPVMIEAFRFLGIIIKSEGKRREMIQRAKGKVNGRFNRQIKQILTGGDTNDKTN